MYRYLGVLQKAFGMQNQSGLPDSFMLNGRSTLQSLAHFYGLKVPVSDAQMSVADYLTRVCYGQPRIGDRTLWDQRIELTVREIEDGKIKMVCLKILPGQLPERRRPWPFEGAHNFMRRTADHRRDRRHAIRAK